MRPIRITEYLIHYGIILCLVTIWNLHPQVLLTKKTALALEEDSTSNLSYSAQKILFKDSTRPSSAAAPRVGINGAGCAYDTIQEAVTAAVSGDTIQVSTGTYNESIIIWKDLAISGDYDGACTSTGGGLSTIDGAGLSPGSLVAIDSSRVTLSNLDIINGTGGIHGGGISLTTGAQVNLDQVNLVRNSALYGGGVSIDAGTMMTVTNSTIFANGALNDGGGFWVEGDLIVEGGTEIRNNRASEGGGIFVEDGTVDIDDSSVKLNRATDTNGKGGGIYAIVNSRIHIGNGSLVNENEAYDGAGIYADDSTVVVHIGFFASNEASNNGGGIFLSDGAELDGSAVRIGGEGTDLGNRAISGAGVYAITSTLNLTGTQIYANVAETSGAGIYAENAVTNFYSVTIGGVELDKANQLGVSGHYGVGLYLTDHTTATLNTSNVAGNLFTTTGATYGGGIYANDSSSLFVENNSRIQFNNSPSAASGQGAGIFADNAVVTLDNSLVFSNTAGTNGGGLGLINGSILTMQNNAVVSNNVAEGGFGGGVYVHNLSTLLMKSESRVEYNTALDAIGQGAGIFVSNASVTVDKSQVISNTAWLIGGGIALVDGSVVNLKNSAIVSFNKVEDGVGGGIAAPDLDETNDINITNSTLQHNEAGTDGGAIYLNAGTLDLTGWWDLRWNSAGHSGGGIAVTGTGDVDFSVSSLDNDSFLGMNVAAGGDGGGLYHGSNGVVRLVATGGYWINLSTNNASNYGGGAAVDNGGALELIGNVQMNSNSASIDGGAVFLDDASILSLEASGTDYPRIEANWADQGGGVFSTSESTIHCEGGVFGSDNQALDGSGGAIYMETSTLKTYNCGFFRNTAVDHGGAIFSHSSSMQIVSDFSKCNPLLTQCSIFSGNQADSDEDDAGDGGAIYVLDSELKLSHTIFYTNSAYLGGAVFQTAKGSESQVVDSLFYRNDVHGGDGSAIWLDDGNFSLEHVTLANNTGGPAFYAMSTEILEVYNSIAWANLVGFSGTSPFAYGCNIDQSGLVGLVSDPLFLDPGVGDDYHLSSGSPAIDACTTGLPVDLDGVSRPISGLFDMGVFEYLIHIFLPIILR